MGQQIVQRSEGYKDKRTRQGILAEVLREHPTGNQTELLKKMKKQGFKTTQASVSRDLSELGAVKVDGVYRLPTIEPGQSAIVDRLHAECAGENLIVLKTGPGHAPVAGVHIDKAKIPEIIGTIAGDDTIFIAVAGRAEQLRVIKKVFSVLNHD